VHGIVRALRGTIDVAARPGAGTRFVVELPLAPPGERAPTPAPATPRVAARRVWLVEDEAHVRGVALRMLEAAGAVVEAFASAEAALARAAAPAVAAPDVLVTDTVMPGASGVELAHVLTQRWPDLAVVVTSGYQDQGAALDARWLPVPKPFTSGELTRAVERAAEATPRQGDGAR
jgi:DNA-binding NtrC family response regulator